MITAEKEMLFGLHRFVGYLLHNRTATASSSASTLPRGDYEAVVRNYLRHVDPYTPRDDLEQSSER